MQKRDNGYIYAMKVLRKADMLEKEQACTDAYKAWINSGPVGGTRACGAGCAGDGQQPLGGQDVLLIPSMIK